VLTLGVGTYRRQGTWAATQEIVWRFLVGGKYQEIAPNSDGWYRSRVFAGLGLDPAALWSGDLPALAAAVQKGVAKPMV
jgi:hypothetical protein